jgi:integrase
MPNARCIRAAQLQAHGLAVFAPVPSRLAASGAVEAVGAGTGRP